MGWSRHGGPRRFHDDALRLVVAASSLITASISYDPVTNELSQEAKNNEVALSHILEAGNQRPRWQHGPAPSEPGQALPSLSQLPVAPGKPCRSLAVAVSLRLTSIYLCVSLCLYLLFKDISNTGFATLITYDLISTYCIYEGHLPQYFPTTFSSSGRAGICGTLLTALQLPPFQIRQLS